MGKDSLHSIKHNENEFANLQNYIDINCEFYGFAKFKLAKFRGIKKENFVLHLKETEFRYNTKILGQNSHQNLLKLIRENPIKVS